LDATTAKIIEPWIKNHMDNARLAFDYFVGQGLSPVQAAGIVGNLQGESGQGLNPQAINPGDGRDGSDSVGIAQWNSTRAQALKDYAASKGTSWNDLNTQLEFLHQELKGPETAAYSRLLAAKTPEEAGQAVLAFERPKDWNKPGAHPERGQYAAKVFAAYGGGQSAPAPQAAAALPSAPLQLAPQAPPIFAAAPQQAQQQAVGLFDAMPAEQMQAPPIFFAPRRSPDLSKLRSAFKAPIFSRG
jgi:hypothetical protein